MYGIKNICAENFISVIYSEPWNPIHYTSINHHFDVFLEEGITAKTATQPVKNTNAKAFLCVCYVIKLNMMWLPVTRFCVAILTDSAITKFAYKITKLHVELSTSVQVATKFLTVLRIINTVFSFAVTVIDLWRLQVTNVTWWTNQQKGASAHHLVSATYFVPLSTQVPNSAHLVCMRPWFDFENKALHVFRKVHSFRLRSHAEYRYTCGKYGYSTVYWWKPVRVWN